MNILTNFFNKKNKASLDNKILYKTKKYVMSMIYNNELCDDKYIEKPDCQRLIDTEQVNKLFNYQVEHYKNHEEFFFTSPLTLAKLDNKYYILDGQHRLTCIEMLSNSDYPKFPIPLVILFVDSIKELDEKYLAINQNKPVPLPNNINDWKNFGKFIEKHLQQSYNKYFSNSDRPIVPNFNKELLLKYINDNDIANKVKCNYELFIQEIETLNQYYQQSYSTVLVKHFQKNILKQINRSKEKQPDNPLFLSLFRNFEWIDRIVYKITNNINYEKMIHITRDHRVKIKTKLKRAVWNKHSDNTLSGKCFTCSDEIDYDNFHCGHIKSVFYGGKTKLSNLEPICSTCNINMGIENLEVYKRELDAELV